MWMKKITKEEFQELTLNADILMSDKYGVKVLQTANLKIIKLFRLKRFFSSALIYPYALRFRRNAAALKKRGISTVKVESAYSIPSIQRDIVVYQRLDGRVLRAALADNSMNSRNGLTEKFAEFFTELHDKGIFFRSIHYGNVIVLPDGKFALIDIADMSFTFFGGLTLWQRLRNYKHMCRYPQDLKFLEKFGADRFIDAYLNKSELHDIMKWIAGKLIRRYFERILPT